MTGFMVFTHVCKLRKNMPLPAGPGIFSAETGAPAVSGELPTLLLSELLMTSEPHTAWRYHAAIQFTHVAFESGNLLSNILSVLHGLHLVTLSKKCSLLSWDWRKGLFSSSMPGYCHPDLPLRSLVLSSHLQFPSIMKQGIISGMRMVQRPGLEYHKVFLIFGVFK